MKLGDALKKIRVNKGLTQKEVAFEVTSRSYLSLLENNKYIPTFTLFDQLINRLSITYEEFIYILNDNTPPNSRSIFIELSLLANKHDLDGLKDLENRSFSLYQKEHHLYILHISLLSKSLRLYYENKNSPSDEISKILIPIKDYLLSCNSWHLYEMKLFNNSMFGFPIEDALLFSNLALKKIKHYSTFNEFQNSKQHMLLNLSTLLIAYNNYELAYDYATQALNEANTHLLLYERILSKLNMYMCQYLLNTDDTSAKQNISGLLNTLSVLDLDHVKKNYNDILNKHGVQL